MTAKILAFSGSMRRQSINNAFLKIAAAHFKDDGFAVTHIDLPDYELPIYNQDVEIEKGLPENAQKLKALMIEHDAFVIASPEHNGSLSAALKNVLDWTSRHEGKPDISAYKNKLALLLAASPGSLGGIRGLTHLRTILSGMTVTVFGNQVCLPAALDNLDNGTLKNDMIAKMLKNNCRHFGELVSRAITA